MHGFKSFAKPTELVFGDNYNTIIGPNGSGKSNIADSLCFVLGKTSAKSMRAEKSANLIYNGGKTGSPSKQAEVSIIFDNPDKEFPVKEREVKITRIVKQSGNSIYKVNDNVMTKQQILDLLSTAKIDPDGYNIVLQGDIARFMEMHPEERRQLIEDIAGISVYEDKKQKALLELEKVDSKLNEAEIILKERETYLKEVAKEREQALLFKDLEEKIKINKATLLTSLMKNKLEQKKEIESSLNKNESNLKEVEDNISKLKSIINQKKEEIKNINFELEEKSGIEQVKLSKDISDLRSEIAKSSTRQDAIKSELEKIRTRKQQLNSNLIDLDKKILSLEKEKSSIKTSIEKLTKNKQDIEKSISKIKEKLPSIDFTNIDKIESDLEHIQESIFNLKENKQKFTLDKNRLEFQLKSINDSIQKIESSLKNKDLNNFNNELKSIIKNLEKASNEEFAINNQIKAARDKLILSHDSLAKLQAKNTAFKEFLNVNQAVKKILSFNNKGIYGTISQLGKTDPKYTLALEVAAGPRLQSIIVDSDITAAKCIEILKREKIGIASFLPLNKIRPSNDSIVKSLAKNSLGLAIDLIKFDSKYKNAFEYVFGSTLIVENFEEAKKLGINRSRMVTLDGTLIEVSGAMHGGHRQKSSFGFKDQSLDSNIDKEEKELTRLKETISILDNKKTENENLIINLKQQKSEIEANILKIESLINIKDLDKFKREKLDLEEKISNLNRTLSTIEKDLLKFINDESLSKEKKAKIKDFMQKSDSRISPDLDNLQKQHQLTNEEIIRFNSEIKNLDIQITSIHQTEKEKTSSVIQQQEKEYQQFTSEFNNLQKEIEQQKYLLKENESKEKQFYSNFKDLTIKRNKSSDDIQKSEALIVKEEEKIKLIEKRINNISLDKGKIDAELSSLETEFEPFKEVKIRHNVPLDELKEEIKKHERQLSSIGAVNLRSLEVYEEIEKEYQNLLDKASKLKTEKESVLNMMIEIEQKKSGLFMQTFNAIEKNFTTIFSSLSKKGQAYLEIENKEDPLNGGVDIKVKITSNKFLDIRSLSGGEKTLTALAFIFSIQEHQPASFYFLDEVDAALDKTNSELLSKLIAEYSKRAQYIVISHNDAVITEANYIYGVSMLENTISKIISLKI